MIDLQLEDGLHAAAEFSSDVAAGAGAVAAQAGDIASQAGAIADPAVFRDRAIQWHQGKRCQPEGRDRRLRAHPEG